MSEKQRVYLCIDMKTFYASVECAERNYNPFETNLVVADLTRGDNALCLAITPKLKAQGIRNRCRLSEIPKSIRYEVAPPRMALYIKYAADIYSLYLDYFDAQDIHVYSIDEAFIDATGYLKLYNTDGCGLANRLMKEILNRFHIPSTAGVGTNLYLAKIALDITAKHSREHIGYLDEEAYKSTLWTHKPITDFWMIAAGTERRLARLGVYDMQGITQMPTDLMYKMFGKNAELLIDHAWGRETCLMEDIKKYNTKSKSVSFSQILPRDYSFAEARTVMQEMTIKGCEELVTRRLITKSVSVMVGYSRDAVPATVGNVRLTLATGLKSKISPAVMREYDKTTETGVPIRRLAVVFRDVCDEACEGYDFFTDFDAVQREKSLDRTVHGIRNKFGKNAMLNGLNYLPEGTQKERNTFIGGHRAGYGDI